MSTEKRFRFPVEFTAEEFNAVIGSLSAHAGSLWNDDVEGHGDLMEVLDNAKYRMMQGWTLESKEIA